MKKYYTPYEEYLLEYIGELKCHISSRDNHLIKTNGYAPAPPKELSDYGMDDRTNFKATCLSWEKIKESFEFERFNKTPKGGKNFMLITFIGDDKIHRGYDIPINELKKIKSISGKEFIATIQGDFLQINGIGVFMKEFFTNIKPANDIKFIIK